MRLFLIIIFLSSCTVLRPDNETSQACMDFCEYLDLEFLDADVNDNLDERITTC